jgi:hypothetical protein
MEKLQWWRALLLVVLSVPGAQTLARPDLPGEVRDLYYGVVLYDFYQQKYYSASVNLLTAQQMQRLQHSGDEAQLLLGGLYLSYGLHHEAEAIFEDLIDENAVSAVRDRAWFYLGKIRYQKGLFVQAEAVLNRVGDALDETLREELFTLKANLLMAQKNYPQAAEALAVLAQGEGEANYARFNLGVALFRVGRQDEGIALLQQVAVLRSTQDDLKALRDKANLVLGYMLLKSSPVLAKDFLQRVRLQGPFSNKALLALGWAEVELQRYERALVPWSELAARDKVDIAAFESLLAIGNALERLQAYPQARQSYRNAIVVYERELAALKNTTIAVKAGRLWTDLLSQVAENEMGWFWEAELLPDTPEARYLPTLMASHEFHEAIKNLRDLQFLDNKLSRWQQEMPAFDAMLALRHETYEAQLTQLTPEQTLDRVVDVRTSRDIYAEELKRIDSEQDAFALATEKEQKLLQRLARLEERLWRLSSQAKLSAHKAERYRDRYRFFKGLLEYDIQTTYATRRWEVRKSLHSLDQELDAVLAQQDSLQQARKEAPKRFQGFNQRIAQQRTRTSDLQVRVQRAFTEQQRQLQVLTDAELVRLKSRLIDYLDQARFSLAHLQDMAISETQAPTAPENEAEETPK